jgi:hypothetical protein
MPLLDNYEPQGFADRGGLLGRLLSLRPDLAPDRQGDGQPASSTSQSPLWLTSGTSPNTPNNAAGSFAGGTVQPMQYAQAPIGNLSPEPFCVPSEDMPPRSSPLSVGEILGLSPLQLMIGSAAIVGRGLPAALASRGSKGLGEPPERIAPVSPQPAQAPSGDDWQEALGPAWKQLQSYFYSNSRGGNPGDDGGDDKKERCKKEWEDAADDCSKSSRDYNKNILGPFRSKTPWNLQDCMRGLVSEDCGGNLTDYGKQGRPKR